MSKSLIFSTTSHPLLAENIALKLGTKCSPSRLKRFSNDNLLVQLGCDVWGKHCCVVATASAPLHDHLVELFLLLDALVQGGSSHITLVIPYFPYVRSDKLDRVGVSISSQLMARLLATAGAHSILTVDLHSPQQQGFFTVPTRQLSAAKLLCDYLVDALDKSTQPVFVAADIGEAKDLLSFVNLLHYDMAIIDKRRLDDRDTIEAKHIVGNVTNKHVLLVDDEISTGKTMSAAADQVRVHGATDVWALCTHGVFCDGAIERMQSSGISRIITTNTLPQFVRHGSEALQQRLTEDKNCHRDNFVVLDMASMLAKELKNMGFSA